VELCILKRKEEKCLEIYEQDEDALFEYKEYAMHTE
jgi:hypothetical protein